MRKFNHERSVCFEIPNSRLYAACSNEAHMDRRCPGLAAQRTTRFILLLRDTSYIAARSTHFVAKTHDAALISFDLGQMEADISVKIPEE